MKPTIDDKTSAAVGVLWDLPDEAVLAIRSAVLPYSSRSLQAMRIEVCCAIVLQCERVIRERRELAEDSDA